MDDAALRSAINEAYREVFNLQFQKGTHQLQDATSIRRARKRVARLRTILRQRELAVVAGAPIAPLTDASPAAISPQKQRALDEREAAQEVEAESPAPLPSDIADEVAEQIVADVDLDAAAATGDTDPKDAGAADADQKETD